MIMRSFDPEETLKSIDTPSLGITTIFGVPAAFNAMKNISIVDSIDFSRLETVITGAGFGGLVCFNDKKLYENAKMLREYGRSSAIYNQNVGVKPSFGKKIDGIQSVSYTHLTLPTKRIV